MYHASLPPPARRTERLQLAGALGLLALGIALVALVLTGAWHVLRHSTPRLPPTPPVVVVTPTPVAGGAPLVERRPRRRGRAVPAARRAIVAQPVPDGGALVQTAGTAVHVPAAWEAGFYPLYETAARTFGLNWLLLASIHRQETAFSTAPGTYHGLNSVGCCGGPMQFNVRNGPVSTWQLVEDGYRFGRRPATYDHPTRRHPSIYDDFDAIMAAGWLLYSDGAGNGLDGAAWQAAYDYYGHDAFGVTYADQVIARAIGWSQQGFCINCALDQGMVAAVDAAYGAPVRAD